MKTLGETLAENIEREKQSAFDKAAALTQMRTDEEMARFKVGEAFFEKAKKFFTDGITAAVPVKELVVQVGGKRFSAPGKDCNLDFDAIWNGYRSDTAHPERGPNSLHDPKLFAALWVEFQTWARNQGLEAYWASTYDGGGMESWWLLHVRLPVAKTR